MNRLRHSLVLLAAACLVGAAIVPAQSAHAGIGDAIKKLGDKATKKTTESVDKTTVTTTKPGDAPEGEATAGGNEKVSAVSTKFDFVPGDKVLLFDDFTQDELGEFPAKWRLMQGTFEIAEIGRRALAALHQQRRPRSHEAAGSTTPPEFWTLEFDVYCTEPMSSAYSVRGLGASGRTVLGDCPGP